jgi:hypothetical protein
MTMAPAGAVDAATAEDAALVARVAAGDSGDPPSESLFRRHFAVENPYAAAGPSDASRR